MPSITPFKGIRPVKEAAARVAALPYDVYNRKEAYDIVSMEPLSFLKIDRAETQFSDDVDTYDDRVYEKAKELLEGMIGDGIFIIEEKPCYYVYELTMDGRAQTGIVACSSIEDYENCVIKKHESTREDKKIDRIRHVDTTNAHTGPIFLIYRSQKLINDIIEECKKESPVYDFISADGIGHRVWIINETEKITALQDSFGAISCTYIADGHHRCASAVKVGLQRRERNPKHTGEEEYNRFLSVLFPDEQLYIMPYNRVVKDLNGFDADGLLQKIKQNGFSVSYIGNEAVAPAVKGTFGMYLKDSWYLLTADKKLFTSDPVGVLDVSVLQEHLLGPILGIKDPRVDKRIDFVGGIRGLGELEKRAAEDMSIAFSMYPTSIQELLDVADAGLLMPPKSTWFEPKLRSGLFIHSLT